MKLTIPVLLFFCGLLTCGYVSAQVQPVTAKIPTVTQDDSIVSLTPHWLNSLSASTNGQPGGYAGLVTDGYRLDTAPANLDTVNLPSTTDSNNQQTASPWRAVSLLLMMLLAILGIFCFLIFTKYRAKDTQLSDMAQRERLLQQALASSGDELWDWNISARRVTRDNTFMNYHRGEETGDGPLNAVIHPDDRDKVQAALDECLKLGADEFDICYRGLNLDDAWQWVLCHGKVISRTEEGKPSHIMGSIKNIQHLKDSEQALQTINAELEQQVADRNRELAATSERLEATRQELRQTWDELANREKKAALGDLVAGITHEVNTPIGVSVTAASHLRDRVRSFSSAFEQGKVDEEDFIQYQKEISDCCVLMLTNLERASRLISSFKRVSVDQFHDESSEFNLGQYVDDIFLSLHPLLSASHHHYHYRCEPDLHIRSKPGVFYQIISNLFNNSILHAYPNGGTGELTLTIQRHNQGIVMDYRDDGCGMTPEVKANIFTPFFTTKRGQGGSGLGMNIVYDLVHKVLGGQLTLESSPGQGSRFIITLPAHLLVSKRH